MSWLLAFLGFAALIILHELGHFLAAKAVGMRVERFALFFPPLLARKKRGETEYAIGAIPLGGYVKITGMSPNEEIPPEIEARAYYKQPVWKRIIVITAGPAVNIVLALCMLTAYLMIWGVAVPAVTNQVQGVSKDGAAAQLLRDGDRLLAVDGRKGSPERLRDQIATHRCAGEQVDGCRAATPARVTFERDGVQREGSVTPIYNAEAERPLLGFRFGLDRRYEPVGGLGAAITTSVDYSWRVTKLTVQTIAGIFQAEKRKEISGVVGSYESTRQAITISADRTVQLLALISLSLGIINLFPFLPLDGGHIFWALAEKLRGRPIPFRWMERAGLVGLALVMALFVIGLSNDVGRIVTGEGFQVR